MENAKKMAALTAVKHVGTGSIIGLGSGTTVAYALEEIGRRIREDRLEVMGVPTSYHTTHLAWKHNIPLTTLDEHPQLDLAIDGADQVDEALNMIKGMGGALTREKIVASASKMNIIIIDESKLTMKLGRNQPVPIEVLRFALPTTMIEFRKLGGKPVLREASKKLGPVVTDNGNFLVDVKFGPIDSPKELNQTLKNIPGIIETGIFSELANVAYIGGQRTVRKLER
ncbi:MAG: ribose-5-phosphate isomerase RpiA [Candidatus Bathyarchaeota archaeon]|nr:ribose-5-phosphate isomerase RpiA [Candidatus Bathyarchaeota archaeon]